MCKCCSNGKSASKYKKFAFLNGHADSHDHDHHDHDDSDHGKPTDANTAAKTVSERK